MTDLESLKFKKRWRYLKVNCEFIIHAFTNKMFEDELTNPLPEDTKFIRAGTDSLGFMFFVIESESFEPVDVNEQQIPDHGELIFKRNKKKVM